LVHRGRGRKSNRRKDEKFKRKVLRRYEKRYAPVEMGPVLAAEEVAEDGFAIHRETLRRWLNEAGLRTKKRRRAKRRSRGPRKTRPNRKRIGKIGSLFPASYGAVFVSGTTVSWALFFLKISKAGRRMRGS